MSAAKTEDRPSLAGMYDYYLGGTAHTATDRAAAEQVGKLFPDIIDAAWANRGFLQRAVRRMASEWGIRQFLDFGPLLPEQRNTHEVLAEAAPGGRVVYVNSDEQAVARGQAALAGMSGTAVVCGDIRQPEQVLHHPEARRLIDLDEPVGLLLVAVVQFLPDADDPWGILRRYVEAVPAGSALALSALTCDQHAEYLAAARLRICDRTPEPATFRSKADVERFFDGLALTPPYPGAAPGLTYVGHWGAEDPVLADSDGSRWFYAAVARKTREDSGW